MSDSSATDVTQDIEKLRRAVILITRFISDNILDPHSGFEGQFLGAGRNAESVEELLVLLRRLMESLVIIGFSAQQLQQLDRHLQTEGIPPLSFLKTL
jgi:hypothetical protein